MAVGPWEYDLQAVPLDVRDARRLPWLSLALGFLPMLPSVIGAALDWMLAPVAGHLAILFMLIWGGATVAFLQASGGA